MILSAFCYVPSFAEELDVPVDEPVNTEYQHINTIITNLTISGGTAYVGVQVTGIINHTTKIEVTATLQKKSGTNWEKVKSWSQSSNSYMLRLNKTKAVAKGTYRIKNVVKAYKNSDCETITTYSQVITYLITCVGFIDEEFSNEEVEIRFNNHSDNSRCGCNFLYIRV